jgi:hypothetical protein
MLTKNLFKHNVKLLFGNPHLEGKMDYMMGLASVFGPLLLIVGVWGIFYHDNLMKVVASFKATPAAAYLMGLLNVLFGLVILHHYNVWSTGLGVLVTLLGWVFLVRGLLSFFIPQLLHKLTMAKGSRVKVCAVITLVWGFGLCWLAFWS